MCVCALLAKKKITTTTRKKKDFHFLTFLYCLIGKSGEEEDSMPILKTASNSAHAVAS
jgi:hypothetical protein